MYAAPRTSWSLALSASDFCRILKNSMTSASRFFFRRAWPFPASLALFLRFIRFILVGFILPPSLHFSFLPFFRYLSMYSFLILVRSSSGSPARRSHPICRVFSMFLSSNSPWLMNLFSNSLPKPR